MKKTLIIASSLISLIILSSCSNFNKENISLREESEYYFSISVAEEEQNTNNESGIIIENYCYDLESNITEKVETALGYSSQYPLSVYDKDTNTIYYSQRIDIGNSHGDQLFSYNLDTNKTEQLTENLFAINYIIPIGEKVYIAAVKKGKNERNIHVMYYSLNEKKLVEAGIDSNLFFELFTFDPVSGNIFGAAYRGDEDRAALDEEDQRLGKKYLPPDYYVYNFTNDFANPQLMIKTDRKLIRRFCYTPDQQLFFTQADGLPIDEPNYLSQTLDINDKTLKPATDIDNIMYSNNFIYSYKDSLYFLGVNEKDIRGIYKFNIITEELELIFSSDKGNINGFVMLSSK